METAKQPLTLTSFLAGRYRVVPALKPLMGNLSKPVKSMRARSTLLISFAVLLTVVRAEAQVEHSGSQGQGTAIGATTPSVGNGIANGVLKPAGSPSVGDGRSNGIVKRGGDPSVGDGIANGVMKSTTERQ